MNQDILKHFVYPGHPVTIAIEIARVFRTYEAASERTGRGWEAALSHSDVRGAGGAVRTGLHLLRLVHEGMSAEAAFDRGTVLWAAARESDFSANLKTGQDEADALRPVFIDEITEWAKTCG